MSRMYSCDYIDGARRHLRETLMAPDERAVRALLLGRGVSLVRVREVSSGRPAGKGMISRVIGSRALSGRDRIALLRSIRLRVLNGATAERALLDLIDGESGDRLRRRLLPARSQLMAGRPFHQALRAAGLADEISVRMVHAAEKTGRLPAILDRIITEEDDSFMRWAALAGLILFLLVEIIVAGGVNLVVGQLIIPVFSDLAAEIEHAAQRDLFERMMSLAGIANTLLMTSLALVSGYLLVMTGTLIEIAGRPYEKRQKNLDWMVLKAPVLGRLMISRSLEISLMACARLLAAGQAPMQAIQHTIPTAAIEPTRRYWTGLRTALSRGTALQDAVRAAPLDNGEQAAMAGHGSALHLAHIMESIARDRRADFMVQMKKAGTLSLYLVVLYVLASAAIPLAASMVHGDALQHILRSI